MSIDGFVDFAATVSYRLAERQTTLKIAPITVILVLLLVPLNSLACSVSVCDWGRVEMGSTFTVRITHMGKPLAGVRIDIGKSTDKQSSPKSFGVTAVDGTLRITNLPPGNYSIYTELLGISAGAECFHVNGRSSLRAKTRLQYEWGDYPTPTSQIKGTLFDLTELKVNSPVLPMEGAQFKLQNPLNGASYTTASNQDGRFSFGEIPNGIYVLHIEGGTGHHYDPENILIEISPTATNNTLLLTRMDGGGGSCRDTLLQIQFVRG